MFCASPSGLPSLEFRPSLDEAVDSNLLSHEYSVNRDLQCTYEERVTAASALDNMLMSLNLRPRCNVVRDGVSIVAEKSGKGLG